MSDLKQIERLYSFSYISFIATFFGAVLVFWFFQSIAEPIVLKSWFATFLMLTLARVVVTWRFYNNGHSNTEAWLMTFVILSIISGILWGLTGFILIPKGTLTLFESVLYHGMLLLFIAALISGSLITYSASKMVYLSFSVLAMVPQCLMLISKGDQYHSFLGGFVLAYTCIMFVISIYIHRIFVENSKVELRNELLEFALKKNGIKLE